MMIVAIPKEDLNHWWPSVSPLVEVALEKGYGEMEVEDVHTMLEYGKGILVLAVVGDNVSAAIVVTMIEKPALRELVIMTAGGEELDQWLDEVMDTFDILAREQQADIISVHGRRGWVKQLNKYGYEEIHTTVIKRVQ